MIVCTEHDMDAEITEVTVHGYKGWCPEGHEVEVLGH